MREKVLVTGGAGFIGSHLSATLLKRGYDVVVLDNLSQGNRDWIPAEAEFIEGDIVDMNLCRRASKGVVGIFHAAAMSRVAPSIEKFEYCTEQNIIGTQNMLIAAREEKVRKFVFSASSTYYGNQPGPHHEKMLPDCLNPYALSKYVGEQFCELFTRLYDVPTLSLRYFNVYGPRQPRTGAYALVIGIFLDALQNNKPLCIHGDGKQRRDFVHVKDVVEANIQAFLSPSKGTVCNIGSGINYSIQEIANLISPNQVYGPRRAGDAEVTHADLSHTKRTLNWTPQISLEEGLGELLREVSNKKELTL